MITPLLPNLDNVPNMPMAVSIAVVFFLLAGSVFVFIGALGLVFFRNFYDRLHMPAVGTTLGMIAILSGTSIYISYIEGKLVLHDILIVFFITVAAPISLMMLARAAASRDISKNWHDSSRSLFQPAVTNKTDEQTERETQQEDKQELREQKRSAHSSVAAVAAKHKTHDTLLHKTGGKPSKKPQTATHKPAKH